MFGTSAYTDSSGNTDDHIPFGEAFAKMNAMNEERRRTGRSSSRGSRAKTPQRGSGKQSPKQQRQQPKQQRQQPKQNKQQEQQQFDSQSKLDDDEDDDTLPPNVPTSCHRTLLTLRLVTKEWMRARGHERQLGAYIEAKVVPRGLRIKVEPGANLDEQHHQLWSRELEKGSLELMTLLRNEHRLDSENLLAQMARLTRDMARHVDGEQLNNLLAWAVAGGQAIGRRMERIAASKLDRDLKEYNRNQLMAMNAKCAKFGGRRGRSPGRRYKSRSGRSKSKGANQGKGQQQKNRKQQQQQQQQQRK